MRLRKLIPYTGVLLLAAGCADLDVQNPNEPDTERVLVVPADVLGLIGSSYATWWTAHHGTFSSAGPALSVAADAHSSSWGNFYMREISVEPRQALTNSTSHAYADVIEWPYYQSYSALKSANDALRAITTNQVSMGGDEPMAMAFGKFVQGLSLGMIALIYDQGFIVDETVDPLETSTLELQPYTQVMQAAIQKLEEAAQIAETNTFTTPSDWINGSPLTSTQLARLAHSYIARFLAGVARSVEERQNVNWARVIAEADQGITQDFGPVGEETFWRGVWWDIIKSYGGTFTGWARLDLRTYGMADVSGNYQTWLATPVAQRDGFLITTPDRRITGPTPDSDGTHVRFAGASPFRPERGTYHHSNYADKRWLEYSTTFNTQMVEFSVREVRLLKAEGLMRTGDPAGAAAIINETRIPAGLPPVTADGVPESPNCVPHEPQPTKKCGSLLRALQWEKWVETYHTGVGTEFTDARGWGWLVPGTPIQFPLPAKELQVLQLPVYTFGGVGGPGAAPSIGSSGISFGSVNVGVDYLKHLQVQASRVVPRGGTTRTQ